MVTIRFARRDELARVNELRKQVNDVHVEGCPEIFKPGFQSELCNHINDVWNDPAQEIVVADCDGVICGFAVLIHVVKPENAFMYGRDFLSIDEFCVDRAHRRQGIASALMAFIKNYAAEKGIDRIELNVWEFNRDALAFYEAAGFKTSRRYMELKL